jgi:hypothetical protein
VSHGQHGWETDHTDSKAGFEPKDVKKGEVGIRPFDPCSPWSKESFPFQRSSFMGTSNGEKRNPCDPSSIRAIRGQEGVSNGDRDVQRSMGFG